MSTISDVARLAGVSTATVSRVLNDYAHVSPAVLRLVALALDSLLHRRELLDALWRQW